jgi:hypothetical protein
MSGLAPCPFQASEILLEVNVIDVVLSALGLHGIYVRAPMKTTCR